MGRGRQRAMAKKIAREVKYNSPETDYDALTIELNNTKSVSVRHELKTGYENDNSKNSNSNSNSLSDDELAEQFKWAEETAKKAAKSNKTN